MILSDKQELMSRYNNGIEQAFDLMDRLRLKVEMASEPYMKTSHTNLMLRELQEDKRRLDAVMKDNRVLDESIQNLTIADLRKFKKKEE